MRSVLFVGPTYPPSWVRNRIKDIVVNIVYHDDYNTSTDAVADNVYPVTLDNLTVTPTGISCTVSYINPITGTKVHGSTADGSVIVVPARSGDGDDVFQGGPYNISPCCLSMVNVPNDDTKESIMIVSCTSPLRCSVTDDVLEISADAVTWVDDDDNDNDNDATSSNGVETINGLSATNGDLTITGVGTVTVTVTGQEGDKDE